MAAPACLAAGGSGGRPATADHVDESAIAAIHKEMKVQVAVDSANMTGTVAEIVPAADPASHSFLSRSTCLSQLSCAPDVWNG